MLVAHMISYVLHNTDGTLMELLLPLNSRHRGAILGHLLKMDIDDRLSRFSALADDAYITRYVEGIGFARDIVLGALHDDRLVAVAHGAVYIERGDLVTEIGISVDATVRRRGLGKRLMLSVLAMARAFRIVRACVLFRRDCSAPSALARSLGGHIERDGNEATAVFGLNPSADVPLATMHFACGAASLVAIHPKERGRALLVHGAGGDSYQWASGVIPELFRAGYSVCAPTLPGHGRSRNAPDAQLQELLRCVATHSHSFRPDVIVGHSMGGYLVQRHLEANRVPRAVLLASLPPSVPEADELSHVKAELHCADSRAVLDSALWNAPNVDVLSALPIDLTVIGGHHDRVVPKPWVRYTARRFGVEPLFVDSGHNIMMGRASASVARAIVA